MANGICVYAESYNGELETVAAELVSAAKGLAETTKEKVQAIVLSDHAEELVKELLASILEYMHALKGMTEKKAHRRAFFFCHQSLEWNNLIEMYQI